MSHEQYQEMCERQNAEHAELLEHWEHTHHCPYGEIKQASREMMLRHLAERRQHWN